MWESSQSFYARGVASGGHGALHVRNTGQIPVTLLEFVQNDGSALSFNLNHGQTGPDTTLYINNVARTFRVDFTAELPQHRRYAHVNGHDLRGQKVVGITASNGVSYLFMLDPDTGFLTLQDFPNGAVWLVNKVVCGPPLLICFARGTWIAVPGGESRIEDLHPGDLVTTGNGSAAPLRWVARRRVSVADLTLYPDLAPVLIPAHHFGPGLPDRPLRLSPQHRVQMSGPWVDLLFGTDTILVPAKHLLGDRITQPPVHGSVEYYHLMFDRHEMVLSNGLPTESYQPSQTSIDALDDSLRAEFLALFGNGPTACLLRADAHRSITAPEGRVLAQMLARAA
jgi:Hint domain